MQSLLFTLMVILAPAPQEAATTCEALQAEGRRIQAELEDLQRQRTADASVGRHSTAAVGAGLVLNVLGALTPVRGAETVASAGAMALGLQGRAADRAESEAADADLDRRMDAALDRMEALAVRGEALCGGQPDPR